ncbi:MAG: M24 family metallopeptidase [Thermodesulfobacteriota bacterium]
MHKDILKRLRKKLDKLNVEAYISYTPANLFYTTGYRSPLLEQSQVMMGTDMAIIPTDPAKEPALVVSDFMEDYARKSTDIKDVHTYGMWIECRDIDIITGKTTHSTGQVRPTRPAQYNIEDLHTIIHKVLIDRGLSDATIGTDLKYIKNETIQWLRKTNPKCTFVDVTELLYELRMIKYPQEVDRLRKAAYLSEAGAKYAISKIREGQSSDEIRYNYMRGVFDTVQKKPELGKCEAAWTWISVGSNDECRVKSGNLIKFDSGVILDGYYSDWGRTFCFSKPDKEHKKIYNALSSAHALARNIMKPGIQLSDIHMAATEEVRKYGLINYSRGHYGHSIGIEDHIEEPPFFSADNNNLLTPGMVMCLETPYYSRHLGSIQIEDMIFITENGIENLNTFSHDLLEL